MHTLLSKNEHYWEKEEKQTIYSRYLELFIVGTLSVAISLIYVNAPRWTQVFGEAGFVTVLLWAIYHKRQPVNQIPRYVIIMSVLYILSYVINVFLCSDPNWEHVNIRKYIYILIGGFLFAFPVKYQYQRFMIVIYFTAAAVAGAAGIYQYYKWGIGSRSQGFINNPLHYASVLGFVCCISLTMLFINKRVLFKSRLDIVFLSVIAVLTLGGVLFSQARGVWVAVAMSCIGALSFYNLKKALILSMLSIVILSSVFVASSDLRDRARTIVASCTGIRNDDSIRLRMETWKGALIMFTKHPFFGVGTENFDHHLEKLTREEKIVKMPVMSHAHNIFLQAIATRGLIGFIITLALFTALIQWGFEEIRYNRNVGGYIIILSTAFTIIGGLTENNIEFTRFLATYGFTIGLLSRSGVWQ